MLKHCSPSTVDLRRRSRRNLLLRSQSASSASEEQTHNNASELSSSSSSSSASSCGSSVLSHRSNLSEPFGDRIQEEGEEVEEDSASVTERDRGASEEVVVHVTTMESASATSAAASDKVDASTSPRCTFRKMKLHSSKVYIGHEPQLPSELNTYLSPPGGPPNSEPPPAPAPAPPPPPRSVPIKIYAKCLRSDIEYKTLSVSQHTTSKDLGRRSLQEGSRPNLRKLRKMF